MKITASDRQFVDAILSSPKATETIPDEESPLIITGSKEVGYLVWDTKTFKDLAITRTKAEAVKIAKGGK